MSILFRCGDFVVVWKKFWNSNYLFEVELLQHFLQLRTLSRAARKAFAGRMLCRRGLHELDSRSHSRVDEGVTVGSYRINRLLFADDLVLLASSQQSSACTRSIFSCVRPSRNENQRYEYRGIMALYKSKAVYAASERQYTAAGRDVQAPRSGICEWRKVERGD